FFGLSTDPAAIPPVIVPALILAVVTTLTKIGTGYYAARRAGIKPAGRWRAGGTLVARGEFSIVIAGLAVGVEPRIGPLATAYVLILVIVGPLAARWTEPVARRFSPARKPAAPLPAPAAPAGPAAQEVPAEPAADPGAAVSDAAPAETAAQDAAR
ncbi:cation:proton antiporter, partial [Streptomyces wadayamensis]